MKIGTIVVPTDFSDDAKAALDQAIELAKVFSSRIHLIHAYQVPIAGSQWEISYPADLVDDVRKHAEGAVEELRQKIADQGIEADGEASPGPASVAIVEAAERVGADLIVMGTRGLTGIKHVVLGSVAERTLRHAPCPVLSVKARSD